ncbi:MAG: GumC family protein, partial [Beijerinckiaceae bacterium]
SSISAQQLSELNTQLANARSQQSDLSSKARLLREAVRQGRIFEVSEVVNNESVRRLLENRATLRAQIAQEEQTLLPQHPRVKELRAQLGGLEEQIRASAERTARTLDNDARAAGARVVASQAELDLQKKQNGNASEQEVQLRVLEREAKAEREQLESYLSRYRDASSREGENSVAADARIVSRATVPTNPSFPKKLPIIVVTTLAGLILSLFWILMRALMSDSVYVRRAPEVAAAPMMGMMHPQMMTMYPGMMAQHPGYAAPYPAMAYPPVSPAQMATPPMAAMAEASLDDRNIAQAQAFEASVEQAHASAASSPETAAMRASLEQMGGLIKAKNEAFHPAPPAPVLAPVLVMPATPVLPDLAAQARTIIQSPSLTDIDPYNPLLEIAEVAQTTLLKGRPVSILVFSVEGAAHAATTVDALERILNAKGPALAAVLEHDLITPAGLAAATRSLAGAMDYVIFNGGLVSPESQALCGVTSLAVLVASDDLEDARVDAAAAILNGADYFIVSAESTRVFQRT